MAVKVIELQGIGPITLVKRAQNRSLRLSVTAGSVRVSMPRWTPYAVAQRFAASNIVWIQAELAKQNQTLIESGQRIGKLHYARFEQVLGSQPATSRVTATEIVVRLKSGETIHSASVQKRAYAAAVRALKREAERLLSPRLEALATKHGHSYTSVTVKQLKRRWGSCDSHRAIALNLFLMELPWDYIDYVLMHELAHTVNLDHGPDFWRTLTTMQPRARDLSRTLRKHQPTIGAWPA